jgi:xanthine dehydrogenase accessory factor
LAFALDTFTEFESAPSAAEHQARADWPEFGLVDDIRQALAAALRANEPSALATLYAAEGGAPRGLGAQMLVTRDSVTGYLSGGCVEADVTLHALATIADGQPRRLVYGTGGPLDIRLPCGGQIKLLIERIAPEDDAAHRLVELGERREPAIWLSDGTNRACVARGEVGAFAERLALGVPPSAMSECAGEDETGLVWRHFDPRLRVILFGGDPIVLAAGRLGADMGMDVVVARPKGPESQPPVPGAVYSRVDAQSLFAAIEADPFTAVVVALHDADGDHEALVEALRSRAFYVGLLGSRRRLPEKLERLRQAGIEEADIARLRAPIGLDLGGKSPWEIAVAILAEIAQASHARAPTG